MTPLGGLSVHQSVSQSVSWMDRCGLLDGSLLIIMDELVAVLWMIWSLETWVKADGYCGKKVDDVAINVLLFVFLHGTVQCS